MGNEWERNYYLEPGRVVTADRTASGVEARATAANVSYLQTLANLRQNFFYDLYTNGSATVGWSAGPSNPGMPPRPEPEEETLIEQEENW